MPAATEELTPVYETDTNPNWSIVDQSVTTIHLGSLDGATASIELPGDLAEQFPQLTHLRLWNLQLTRIPALPAGLKVLEVRKCTALTSLPVLPKGLEVLALEELTLLAELPPPPEDNFTSLWDLSLQGCHALPPETLRSFPARCPALRALDLSNCPQLDHILSWQGGLESIRLRNCAQLRSVPTSWPAALRMLDLEGCAALEELGKERLPKSVDYLDLSGTESLRELPLPLGRPRTLYVNNTGLLLPGEILGGDAKANRAAIVWPHLAAEKKADCEVKVILLGNGRAGKTSMMRVLSEPRGQFDEKEDSTHGIRLWKLKVPYKPSETIDTASAPGGNGQEPPPPAEVTVNVWDFAGQDFYHRTHRIFLQSKAVFVLCDTAAGGGADPAGDRRETGRLPEGWDENRALQYWRDQVESLVITVSAKPPMIMVRTKCDRDGEPGMPQKIQDLKARNATATEGHEVIDFSAKTEANARRLLDEIATKASLVLGPPSQHAMTLGVLKVKEKLRKMMAANEKAHKDADKVNATLAEGEPRQAANPPHPTITTAELDEIIKEACKDEEWKDNPGSVIQVLHESGFLYYDEKRFPDTVILDQRWVIEGIYAAFERNSAWPNLLARDGRFTAPEMAQWAWNALGYTPQQQETFLKFMLSCETAYSLGPRRIDSEVEYLVPQALPEYSEEIVKTAQNRRTGSRRSRSIPLSHKYLSRDSVLSLMVQLGKEWGRTPLLWRWGGQFESFRPWRSDEAEETTFVHLNWSPADGDSQRYGGVLNVTQYGPDDSFLTAILGKCRAIPGFEELKSDPLAGQHLPPPSPGDHTGTEDHRPKGSDLNLISVGISFAGEDNGGTPSHWPLALTTWLETNLRCEVVNYKSEEKKPEAEQEKNRRRFLDKVAFCDYIYVFISRKYLVSEVCMYEFLKIWQRSGPERTQPDFVTLLRYQDAYWSTRGNFIQQRNEFRSFWKNWAANEFNQFEDLEDASFRDKYRDYQSLPYFEWVEAIRSNDQLDGIVDTISGTEWKYNKIEIKPSDEDLLKYTEPLRIYSRNKQNFFRAAEDAWKKGTSDEKQRAKRLLVAGFERDAPDAKGEEVEQMLEQPLGDDEDSDRNVIRWAVLRKWREMCRDTVSGPAMGWDDLKARI